MERLFINRREGELLATTPTRTQSVSQSVRFLSPHLVIDGGPGAAAAAVRVGAVPVVLDVRDAQSHDSLKERSLLRDAKRGERGADQGMCFWGDSSKIREHGQGLLCLIIGAGFNDEHIFSTNLMQFGIPYMRQYA